MDEEYIPPWKKSKGKYSLHNICVTCGQGHEKLTKLTDIKLWKGILHAANIRQDDRILSISHDSDDVLPSGIVYNPECRKKYTNKKSLETVQKKQSSGKRDSDPTGEDTSTRSSARLTAEASTSSVKGTLYKQECIFCDKVTKYLHNKRNDKDALVKSTDLRADWTLRNIATAKCDTKILAYTSNELVAKETHYHRTCYRNYTRPQKGHQQGECDSHEEDQSAESNPVKSSECETHVHSHVFSHIRNSLFSTDSASRCNYLSMSELSDILTRNLTEYPPEYLVSAKRNLKRRITAEFGDSVSFIKINNGRIYIIAGHISNTDLAQQLIESELELSKMKTSTTNEEMLWQAAEHLHKLLQSVKHEKPWPPLPEELTEDYVDVPDEVLRFFKIMISGTASDTSAACHSKAVSLSQDSIFMANNGKIIPAKHILLPWVVKALTGSTEIIKILNRLGNSISLSKLEEIITALVVMKCGEDGEDIPLPKCIQKSITTILGYDNIDRREETLDGAGTSHRVNAIITQPNVPTVPEKPPGTREDLPASKRRSIPPVATELLPYINKGRQSPPPITVAHLPQTEASATRSQMKNVIWTYSRSCQQGQQQKTSSWTGWNIETRDNVCVTPDNIGYLPCINASAAQMSTVQEILRQGLSIKEQLCLDSIVIVADQAIYCKLVEIMSGDPVQYASIVVRMGGFHTCGVLLAILGEFKYIIWLMFRWILI